MTWPDEVPDQPASAASARTPFRITPPAPYVPADYRYTTADEILYLRGLQRRGKLDLLKKSLELLPHRSWNGPGMLVDPIQVARLLREMIAGMEQNKGLV